MNSLGWRFWLYNICSRKIPYGYYGAYFVVEKSPVSSIMKSNQTIIRKIHMEQLHFITKLLDIKDPNAQIMDIINRRKSLLNWIMRLHLAQFDSEEVHHRLEDCICPDCQGDLKEIGATLQGQELVFIPAQLKRIDHIQHAYKCQAVRKIRVIKS